MSRSQDRAVYSVDEQGVLQMEGEEVGVRLKQPVREEWKQELERCSKRLKMI